MGTELSGGELLEKLSGLISRWKMFYKKNIYYKKEGKNEASLSNSVWYFFNGLGDIMFDIKRGWQTDYLEDLALARKNMISVHKKRGNTTEQVQDKAESFGKLMEPLKPYLSRIELQFYTL